MADEDITLDGKPLQSLRVADLKAALEQRKLPKSGQKNALIKRLKGALMLENLQKSSSSHSGLQPNSQIGEEMSQNSFIKQYLAKQQELLRQKLEREAQQAADTDESPEAPEEMEELPDRNDSPPFLPDKLRPVAFKPMLARADQEASRPAGAHPGLRMEAPGARGQWASRQPGCEEPRAPSPPRAVASLSVRVLGQPDRQGLPAVPQRPHDKEGLAPAEPGSAHPVLHLSRSAAAAAGGRGRGQEDSDDDEDDEDDEDEDGSEEESEEEEEWGQGAGGGRRPGGGATSQPRPQQQPRPSAPEMSSRSRRKLQPPQHIPQPPRVLPPPMQLRHPTPPPSPPPELSFPLPDTPKQSPPNAEESDGEGPRAADSDSSSRSSSPEPPRQRGPGPLARLARKMAFEKAVAPAAAAEVPGAVDMSVGGAARRSSDAAAAVSVSDEAPPKRRSQEQQQEKRTGEGEGVEATAAAGEEGERERRLPPWKRSRALPGAGPSSDPSARSHNRSVLVRDVAPRPPPSSPPAKPPAGAAVAAPATAGRPRPSTEAPGPSDARPPPAGPRHGSVVVVTQNSGSSSSDSDPGSDSSSRSSRSSSSSRGKPRPAKQIKEPGHRREAEEKTKTRVDEGKSRQKAGREVSEPSEATTREVGPGPQTSAVQEPAAVARPENSNGSLEEVTAPKAFAVRKISLTGSKTTSPSGADGAAGGDPETGGPAARKRRWGSSTAVTTKKPSISITTDSLKSLIPDIKVSQEAVVELHPEELQLSGDEESQGMDNGCGDHDLGLKIRRTVTQVVPLDGQENGQGQEEEEEEEEEEAKAAGRAEKESQRRPSKERRRRKSRSEETTEPQPSPVRQEAEAQKVTPSDSVVRRSISQQKSGMSVTIDEPVETSRQPSPPRGKLSAIVHVSNLVRPFTLGQLKELLNRTGTVQDDVFWIDKIKSHCYVTYATPEEALATRTALHGVKWPQSNPKDLSVDFSQQDELDFHRGVLKPERVPEVHEDQGPPAVVAGPPRLPPLMPERDKGRERERERGGGGGGPPAVRDQWAEREREMQRREQARCEREWDRDKIREFGRPGEDGRRSRSRERERRRRERAKSKERKSDKKDEPPAKMLDDLFLKTKAAPGIYWLPLTEEQAAQRVLDRAERQKERERMRKEQDEEEDKRREEERKERLKAREREAGAPAGGGAGGAASGGRGADAERERERGREREGGDRKRDGYRPRGPSGGGGAGGRRSRSRSNPRDRRR